MALVTVTKLKCHDLLGKKTLIIARRRGGASTLLLHIMSELSNRAPCSLISPCGCDPIYGPVQVQDSINGIVTSQVHPPAVFWDTSATVVPHLLQMVPSGVSTLVITAMDMDIDLGGPLFPFDFVILGFQHQKEVVERLHTLFGRVLGHFNHFQALMFEYTQKYKFLVIDMNEKRALWIAAPLRPRL